MASGTKFLAHPKTRWDKSIRYTFKSEAKTFNISSSIRLIRRLVVKLTSERFAL
jgi:hypothetical protein